jgi:cAMP-dependent protein kinase regulator
LTVNEKLELENLRQEIKKYRDIEINTEKNNESAEHSEEEEDDTIDDAKVEQSINKAKVRMSMPRVGVSSEVYGDFNKKENWVPKHIEKNEDQIHRIKVRILQSFLFSNLDAHDLQIVINAMEEKRFSAGQTVIEQGEAGDCLYAVETGDLDCFKRFVIVYNID